MLRSPLNDAHRSERFFRLFRTGLVDCRLLGRSAGNRVWFKEIDGLELDDQTLKIACRFSVILKKPTMIDRVCFIDDGGYKLSSVALACTMQGIEGDMLRITQRLWHEN